MILSFLTCALLALSTLFASSQCFFTPPEGWEIADPSTLPPSVVISFFKKGVNGFCPSVNLAIEETDVSLAEYLKAVKAIHEQDRSNQWRTLGKVKTAAGLAQLTELDTKTGFGSLRILQAILLHEGRAYVMTAAALKEEISQYYKEFQAAFRSLTLSTDLLGHIPQLERRENLKHRQSELLKAAEEALAAQKETVNPLDIPSFQEDHWLPFQKAVLDQFGDMGAFWQVLILRSAQEKMISLIPPETDITTPDTDIL